MDLTPEEKINFLKIADKETEFAITNYWEGQTGTFVIGVCECITFEITKDYFKARALEWKIENQDNDIKLNKFDARTVSDYFSLNRESVTSIVRLALSMEG